MKKRLTFFFAFMLTLMCCFSSCTDTDCDCKKKLIRQELPKDYKALVDSAVFSYLGRFYAEKDTLLLDSAIVCLNKALRINENLYPAYYYKAIVYLTEGKHQYVVDVVDSAFVFSYPTPDLYFFQGQALAQSNREQQAEDVFRQTSQSFAEWLECYPDSLVLITGELSFIAYHEGKDAASEKLEKYLKKFPDNPILLGFRNMLDDESLLVY